MALFKAFKYLNVKNIYKDTMGSDGTKELFNKVKIFVNQKTREAIAETKLAREKLKDIPGTNYKLGLHHMRIGNLDDAILRFKMVTFLTPAKAEAFYYLGKCLIMNGEAKAAEEALQKALVLKADFPEVKYIMDKVKSPESIEVIPESIISEHIEWCSDATDEEKEIREELDRILVNALLTNVTDKNPNLEVLDLGCGSGGRGRLLKEKEVARKIVGVDMSDKITENLKTEEVNSELIYKNIQNISIKQCFAENKEVFDVIFAGGVFSYQGKLDDIFSGIFKALKSGGLFAVVINRDNLAMGYRLDVTKDKFMHSLEYFEETLEKNGFKIQDKKEKEIGKNKYNIIITKV